MTTTQDPRNETESQRVDRNTMELLQELRVAGLGVQVLFGFLLSLPFTNRFAKLGPVQRDIYLADLLLCVLSTALLLAPVAYHRLVFRMNLKEAVVRDANVMAIAGLICVGLAVAAAVVLIISFVTSGGPAIIIGVFVICLFATLWFAVPLAKRERAEDEHRDGEPVDGHSIEP
ncbi:MAG TPA: DUF6328 family protein [Streptosporangiaceae bacterium]